MNTKDQLTEFLETRRSVRSYQAESLPRETLERLIHTATFAPSAHNKQPWRFVILETQSVKSALADGLCTTFSDQMVAEGAAEVDIQNRLARTRARLLEAPGVILVCRDTTEVRPQVEASRQQAEIWMARQSVAMAGLQLLLAAHAEGLGATWICWPLFAAECVSRILELPGQWEPEGMIFLGHPAESPQLPGRTNTADLIRYR